MSRKSDAQDRIDALQPKLVCATKLVTDLETAKIELEEFDTIGELDDAIERVGNLITDIKIEIKAAEAVRDKK